MTRIALNIATIFATLTGLAVLWEFRGAALIFCMSLALAAAVRPAIEYFVHRRYPVALAVAATYLPLIAIFGFLIAIAVSRLGSEFNAMANNSVQAFTEINTRWRQDGNPIEKLIAQSIPSSLESKSAPAVDKTAQTTEEALRAASQRASASAGEGGWELGIAKTLFGLTLTVAGVIFDLLLITVMSIYWSLDQVHFERLWLSLLAAGRRAPARAVWRAIETEIGRYLRSEYLQSLIAGVLLALGYWVIGIQYPFLLAILGAAAWLIPSIEALIAVLVLAVSSLPALITDTGWHTMLALAGAIVYTTFVLLLLEIVVEPRLFNRQRYSTVLTAFVAISLAMVWGVFGLLVGPPLAVVLQIFGSFLFRRRLGLATDAVQTPAEVAVQLAELRAVMDRSATPQPELASMMERLCALSDEVQQEIDPRGLTNLANDPIGRRDSTVAGTARP